MAAGVYIHIPFCKSRCSYCDFATDIYRDAGVVDRYVDALCVEIDAFSPDGESEVAADTIYFGGGTPSMLAASQVERILNAVHRKFDISDSPEVTMEMNPATVTAETLTAYRDLGVDRASFGVQTFDDRALRLLARGHDANEARQTFRLLRNAGFGNVSFDLIAGLPGQTLEDWEANLSEAIEMDPEHLSLYLLEIHEGTPLAEQVRSGRSPAPDEELAAEMYEMMLDRLAAAGYSQYEISNFSKSGFESRHNSKYWHMEPVYGFGVSAHSFDGQRRYANERDTRRYVDIIETGATPRIEGEPTNEEQLAGESAFLSLRLNEGLDLASYRTRFGVDVLDRYRVDLDELTDAGLLEIRDDRLRLTRRGMLYSNEVFAIFI